MTDQPKLESVPSYKNVATDDKHLFRVVDREGNWTHYLQTELGRYIPAVNHILNVGFPKGDGLIRWLKSKTAEEADKILAHAGERGSRVHYAIRDLIKGQTLSIAAYYENEDGTSTPLKIEEWDYILSWAAWAEVFKPQMLKHETAVWNKANYAGTVDFIGTIKIPADSKIYIDDKLTTIKEEKTISILADWKSSGGIYDNYKLQVAAYAACMKTKPKGEFYTAIVRIGTQHKNGGFEMKLWSRSQTLKHYKQFLNAKDTYHFVTGKDWTPEIEQIPLVIAVNVPKINVEKKGKNEHKGNNNKRKIR